MREKFFNLIVVITVLGLSGCSNSQTKTSGALDYIATPAVVVKTPQEWLEAISVASLANEDIASYLDTRTCIPVSSKVCDANNECKEAQPSTFLFVSSFEPSTGETLSLTTNVYRCDEAGSCEKNEYSDYLDPTDNTEKFQIKDREISISDGQYTDQSAVGLNTVMNVGTCYYRDELNIADAKVETANEYDKICEVDESNFSIDSVGINKTFILKQDAELRSSPVTMDCNILGILPKGEEISIRVETSGAVNPDEKYVWLQVNFDGQTGWIRGDYLDDQFQR